MEEMGLLLKLQELDLELHRFEAEQASLPAEMEQLEHEYSQLGTGLESQESALKALKVAIREAESKTAHLEEISTKYKQQLLTVKTNREYSALLTEIESVKREKEELEEQIIKQMEKTEAASLEIEQLRRKLGELSAVKKEKQAELDLKLKEIGGEISVRKRKRQELSRQVKSPVLRLYERIMNSKTNRAVVALRNGSCGGCFAHVPLQKVADIRKADQIHTCESCGRILYCEDKRAN